MEFQQSFYKQSNHVGSSSGLHKEQSNMPIQFVFIDESSRDSKRLKITRACESCRRRKVKCDAPHCAPGEPCTSCRRLNVDCVMQQQGPENEDRMTPDDEKNARYLQKNEHVSRDVSSIASNPSPKSPTGSEGSLRNTRKPQPTSREQGSLAANRPRHKPNSSMSDSQQMPSEPFDSFDANALTDIFGNLTIQLNGKASFLLDPQSSHMAQLKENDPRNNFPWKQSEVSQAFPTSFATIEKYLPEEDLASDLLNLYFDNIHPYLPVINKTIFMSHWLSNRRPEISPYLLLSLFACAARYSSDPRVLGRGDDPQSGGDLWYSLALQYKEDFRDAPRISTLQAEIINLKALETRPKLRGFSYRCWNMLGSILQMGKDLALDKLINSPMHDADSVSGRRVWQVCLILDQMLSTSQGREMRLDMSEVDLTLLADSQQICRELDPQEINTQNDFVYLVGLVKILRRCSEVYRQAGIQFPFGAEPQYPALNEILVRWRANLPEHLRFRPFVDKRLPSPFVAHLHLTYYLIVCSLHRPWIVSTGQYGLSGEWREHLRLCNDAAREALIVREMLLDQYGAPGIKWMLRGNNYATYSAVITTMIHAVCLTCPEPEFNEGARDALNRGITILDTLAEINATPQMQTQLAMLKQIFSSPTAAVEPSFDVSVMPPELNALQEQYRMMQEADMLQGHRSMPSKSMAKESSNTYNMHHHTPFQQSPESYTSAPMSYDVTSSNDAYYHQQMTGSMSEDLSGSFSREMNHISPHVSQGQWNPAGLIGAWNLNFPYASVGYEYASADPQMAHLSGHDSQSQQQHFLPYDTQGYDHQSATTTKISLHY